MAGAQPDDLQSVIDQFRQALQNLETGDKKELARLFAEYFRLCEQANRRLRECDLLVQRGQYSNAVATSEQEPNLLILCGLLEIPERDSLAEIAQQVGVKAPPPLNYELTESLQLAYDKSSTVASNLSRLHKLTLARAPLPARLAVMRLLLIQNPNHPFMDADIRVFEKHWFKQAQEFAANWSKKGRPEVVQEVYSDLLESGYLETPPSALIANLRIQVEKIQAARLPPLADQMRQFFQAKSLEGMKACAQQWRELTGDGTEEAARRYGVAAALAWVQQAVDADSARERRRDARAQMVRLLAQSDSALADLRSAYQSLQQLRALDRDLEQKYNERIARFGRKRAMLIAGCAISATILFAVAALFFLNRNAATDRAASVDQLVAALTVLIDAGNYELAFGKAKEAPNSIASDPKVVVLLRRAEEQDPRRKALEQACRDLEGCPADGDIQPLLDHARALAKDEASRRRVADLEQHWRQAQREEKNKAKHEFEQRALALQASVRRLAETARAAGPPDRLANDLQSARAQLADLRQDARKNKFDERLLQDVEQTTATIDRWVAVSKTLGELGAELKVVEGDTPKLERIAICLTDTLAPLSPDEVWARQARMAKPSLTKWKSAVQLGDSLQSVERVGNHLPNTWRDPPLIAVLKAASQYSEMYRERQRDQTGTAVSEFKTQISALDVKGLWVIRQRGATTRYYSRTEPIGSGPQQIEVLVKSGGETVRTPFNDLVERERAPQSKFAVEALALLSGPTDSPGWEAGIAKHYHALLDTQDIDPLLKLRLVRGMLDLAVKTSTGFRQLLDPSDEYKALTGAEGNIQADWIDQALDLTEERRQAESLIARAPRLNDEQAIALNAKLLEQIKRGLLLVGWLARDVEGQITLARFGDRQPGIDSRLYTVVEATWNDIGVFEATGAKLKPTADRFLGWPIFAVHPFVNFSP